MKKDGFDANVTFGKYKLHTIKIAMLYILFQFLSLKVIYFEKGGTFSIIYEYINYYDDQRLVFSYTCMEL